MDNLEFDEATYLSLASARTKKQKKSILLKKSENKRKKMNWLFRL